MGHSQRAAIVLAVVLVAVSTAVPAGARVTADGSVPPVVDSVAASADESTVSTADAASTVDDSSLVVDADGDAGYTSIGAAVADASAGDTITVRPGTYRVQVTLDANVTVVAPDGATLDGSEFDGRATAFTIADGYVPVVEGFTVRNYTVGVDAERPARFGVSEATWDTGWTVRNVTIENCSEDAIRAGSSMADWTVVDAGAPVTDVDTGTRTATAGDATTSGPVSPTTATRTSAREPTETTRTTDGGEPADRSSPLVTLTGAIVLGAVVLGGLLGGLFVRSRR
jgi:hypothetical protein